MKKAGIVIIVVGLLFTIVTGFRFFTKKKGSRSGPAADQQV